MRQTQTPPVEWWRWEKKLYKVGSILISFILALKPLTLSVGDARRQEVLSLTSALIIPQVFYKVKVGSTFGVSICVSFFVARMA